MFSLTELEAAHDLVRQAMQPSPALVWPLLCARLSGEVVVKHENHNPTGAFKVRGGLTYLAALQDWNPRAKAIVSATRGNHGQSLAFAARSRGLEAIIFVPHGNSVEKNAAMRAGGARLIEHGSDFQAARAEAERYAIQHGRPMVPSFHRDLVRGVATYSWELLRAHPDLDALYVPIGQGSGVCGAIAARDALGLRTEIVGVQAEGAPAYARSFEVRSLVTTPSADTCADGMATRVPDAEALEIIWKGAARIVLVSEAEIAQAVRAYWTDAHNLAEGAGAAGLAAALKEKGRHEKIGLVLSGGNIDFDLFQRWIVQDTQK